jgi:hypothetical protein
MRALILGAAIAAALFRGADRPLVDDFEMYRGGLCRQRPESESPGHRADPC